MKSVRYHEWEDGVWHALSTGQIAWRTDGLWRVQIFDSSSMFRVWTEPPQGRAARWVNQEFPEHITTLEDKKEYALAIWRLES